MRTALFGAAIIAAGIALHPPAARIARGFARSIPRPELEVYFAQRLLADPGDEHALREMIRLRNEAGDYDSELDYRRRLLAVRSDDAENLEMVMNHFMWNNRPEEAYDAAVKLAAVQPDRKDVREKLVELAQYTGRGAESRADALWLLERGRRTPHMALAVIAAKDAEGIACMFASPGPRARALLAAGAYRESIASFEEHLALEPRDFDARRSLAQVFVWQGRPMDAARELEICLAAEKRPEVRAELVRIYKSLSRVDLVLPHIEDEVERAGMLVILGRYDEARELYRKHGKLDELLTLSEAAHEDEEVALREAMPRTEENLKRLASLYAWRREFAKALPIFEELDDPAAVEMHLSLGDRDAAIRTAERLKLYARAGYLHLWAGNRDGAIANLERAPEARLDLIRLYIDAGRRNEAIAMLDAMKDEDPYTRAELYLYAGRGDLAKALILALPADRLDFDRIGQLARHADDETAMPLLQLLLEHQPGQERWLALLAVVHGRAGRYNEQARILEELLARNPDSPALLEELIVAYDALNRPNDANRALRALLALRPDDVDLIARLGLRLGDIALLERAYDLGSRDPLVLRRLVELSLAHGRREDAVRFLRAYHAVDKGDHETHFALAELTGDEREYDLAWSMLPPDEHRIRALILMHRGDLAGAMEQFKLMGEFKTAVDLLIQLGRYDEAEKLPMTLRQRAVVALARGRFEDAVALLKQLDVQDPEIREPLAESLYSLGRWQEAEEFANEEQLKRIRGTHHPEGSTAFELYKGEDEDRTSLAARYRFHVSEPAYLRLDGAWSRFDGDVAGTGNDSFSLERLNGTIYYQLNEMWRVGGGLSLWNASGGASIAGLLDARLTGTGWVAEFESEINGPWFDTVEAAAVDGTRHRAQVQGGFWPMKRLFASAALESLWYQANDLEVSGENVSEYRLRLRGEYRLWTGEGSVGQHFFDLPLRYESVLQTHVGIGLQYDHSDASGSDDLIEFAQLVESTRMVTLGPVAAYADETWGVLANVFTGFDTARDLGIADLWGGSIQGVLVPAEQWKLYGSLQYWSEQTRTSSGAGLVATIGANFNF